MYILISLLVSLTLAEMMFAMGLRLRFSELKDAVSCSRWFLFRAVIANYLIIPGMTLLIILIFHLSPMVALGLLILAVSPAAPYTLPFTIIARGDLAVSTGLMVFLAGISAIMAPLLLHLLLPVISSGNLSVTIDPVKMIGILFVIQLLPLCLGLALGHWRPELSSTLRLPSSQVSKILNILMITVIVILQFKVMTGIGFEEIFLMIMLVFAGIITGWFLGWPGKGNRISLSIITSMRNMSIAATSFPGFPVLTTILAYSFVAGSGVLAFAFILRLINP
jgi:BASS family bile acid:Na+ symporter